MFPPLCSFIVSTPGCTLLAPGTLFVRKLRAAPEEDAPELIGLSMQREHRRRKFVNWKLVSVVLKTWKVAMRLLKKGHAACAIPV